MHNRVDRIRLTAERRRKAALLSLFVSVCVLATVVSCAVDRPARHRQRTPIKRMTTSAVVLESDLRVRIATDEHTITLSGPASILVASTDRPTLLKRFSTPLSVRLDPDSFVVEAGHEQADFHRTGTLLLRSADTAEPLRIDGERRAGRAFELRADRDHREPMFDIVEIVSIEAYLPGVVGKELPMGWPASCYEAQAIAARSYALHERNRARAKGRWHDLEADTRDQAYEGLTENTDAIEAVRRTVGVILTWQGTPLRAYYSSTCGGRGACAADIWPTSRGHGYNLAAPLQSQVRTAHCQRSPRYRWTVTRDKDVFVRRLAAYGKHHGLAVRDIRSLGTIAVDGVNAVNRPLLYKIADHTGKWWPLSSEQLRNACNFRGDARLPPLFRETRVPSGDFTAQVTVTEVLLQGQGFGHGVGMCQYGAAQLAREGHTATEILRHYYPGAMLSRLRK